MGDPAVIGEVVIFAGNYPPMGWAFCDGRILQINQYQALFAVIGNRYGGDGINNFALPDLRGRTPLGMGAAPGRTARNIAEQGGREKVGLAANELPAHNHTASSTAGSINGQLNCAQEDGASTSPMGACIGAHAGAFRTSGSAGVMNAGSVSIDPGALAITTATGNTGNSIPHENMQPFLVCNYIIALEGIFPQRP